MSSVEKVLLLARVCRRRALVAPGTKERLCECGGGRVCVDATTW